MGKKINLKALVDKGSNKVIFVESGDTFIDVVLSFLTIPLGIIIMLGREYSAQVKIGCMNNLYLSVEKFNQGELLSDASRKMLLLPPNAAESHCKSLVFQIDHNAKPTRYFGCSRFLKQTTRKLFRYSPGTTLCRACGFNTSGKITFYVDVPSAFVKKQTMLLISDNLKLIFPDSKSFIPLCTQLKVKRTKTLDLSIGVEEVINILTSSLISKTPLTETLLKHKPVAKLSNENNYQATHIDPQTVGETVLTEEDPQTVGETAVLTEEDPQTVGETAVQTEEDPQTVGETVLTEEDNISIKLIISKSKNFVCYAEAGADFVNLLFSFLTLPLGFVAKQIQDGSLKGCIDQLYRSVQDLDAQHLKSNHHKEMLVNPKVAPGFCYNSPLGIEEASYYYLNGKPTTDSSLFSSTGFLEGPTSFTVTDNLVITPLSAPLQVSILGKLHVPFTDTEERVVLMGKKEALSLLVASFDSDSALTNAFISKPYQA
ncbi:unnamed protein product [Malus baccata var. baccata]